MGIPVDPVLQDAFRRARTVSLNGQMLRLTPDDVTTLDSSKLLPTWKPGLLTPHMEVVYRRDHDCTALHVKEWGLQDKYGPRTQRWSSGIYAGGVRFPPYCVACLRPAQRFEVVQVLHGKDVAVGRQQISTDSQEEAERISHAWLWDRYWFAVPYCGEHGLKSKAMSIKFGGSEFTFGFVQPEYGKEFAELNRLRAVWRSKAFLVKTKLLYPFLLAASGLSAFSGLLLTLRGLKGGLGKAPALPTDVPVGISLIVIAVVVGVVVIRLFLRAEAESDALES